MSRLLVLLPSVPAQLDSGAKIRNRGLLELLSEQHEVDAIAFGSQADSEALAKLARRAVVVPKPQHRSARRRLLDMVRNDLPDMAQRLWTPGFHEAVCSLLKDRHYDAVQSEGIELVRYLAAVPVARRIYDAHNAEFLLQRRLATTSSSVAGVYSRLQWRRLERFERAVVRHSRLTLAVSNHDANQLLALGGAEANVRVVPSGIDVTAYPFRLPTADAQPNLLFLGKLDFRPNAEAVAWFIDAVLRRHVEQARLFAVGAHPPRWLVEAGQHDERIAVTGYVPEEQWYLARCSALVLPLRTGGGSRLKALVAMASGLPIVSTHVGMEGIDAEPETHFLVADSTSEWVINLNRVLRDVELRQRLARNARRLVEERYDWAAIRADLRAAYASVVT